MEKRQQINAGLKKKTSNNSYGKSPKKSVLLSGKKSFQRSMSIDNTKKEHLETDNHSEGVVNVTEFNNFMDQSSYSSSDSDNRE